MEVPGLNPGDQFFDNFVYFCGDCSIRVFQYCKYTPGFIFSVEFVTAVSCKQQQV